MDPTNGDRSKITIDSSYGVGEMVVSGQVTPDNIMLDKVTLAVVSEHLGDKHAELVPDAGAGRLVEREVDAERRGRRSLSDAELTAVAQMAKRAEKHYKCPQDIEWALDADLPDGENLLLLQSRPETVHSSKPVLRPRQPPAAARRQAATSAAAPLAPTPATRPAARRVCGFSLGSITASPAQAVRSKHTNVPPKLPSSQAPSKRPHTRLNAEPIERTAMSLKSFPKPSKLPVNRCESS